jgi:hypothetical protein
MLYVSSLQSLSGVPTLPMWASSHAVGQYHLLSNPCMLKRMQCFQNTEQGVYDESQRSLSNSLAQPCHLKCLAPKKSVDETSYMQRHCG